MKRYDEYKQTGTPWIGEIPSHWEVMPIKFTAKIYNGDSLNDNQKSIYGNCDDVDSIPYIASKDIGRDSKFVDYENGIRIPEGGKGFSVARPNTTLLCIEGGSAGKKTAYVNQRVCFVNKLCCFDSKLFDKYNYYFICSNTFKDPFSKNLQGMIGGVTISGIKKFPIIVPPLSEQEAIAAYLDKKCGSIDAVISTQERRIALLEELKQSVITEAVTHGINPDTKLRPSGIDWIGNIPEHWEVMPLKYAANKKGCCFIDGDWIESKDIVEEGIKYITTGNIGALYYKEQGSGYISEKTFISLACTEVFEGDILISRLNEPIGRSCIIPNLGNRVVTSVDNVIFRPDTDYYNKKFILYYLNCNKFTEHANLIARGATMHRISRSMLGHQKMLVPPLREQEEIVEYIDRKIKPIDASIAKAKREIELLKELKQSVITEAVTGKIKVC